MYYEGLATEEIHSIGEKFYLAENFNRGRHLLLADLLVFLLLGRSLQQQIIICSRSNVNRAIYDGLSTNVICGLSHVLCGTFLKYQPNIGFALAMVNLRILTLSPCHGKDPLLKYMRTYPRLSMSSRRDCSIPRCALIEAYLRRRIMYTDDKKFRRQNCRSRQN